MLQLGNLLIEILSLLGLDVTLREVYRFIFTTLNGPFAMSDLVRVLIVIPVFLYASYKDIQERRVHDYVWAPLLLAGVLLLAYDFLTGTLEYLAPLAAINFMFCVILGLVLYNYRLFYGADMKALIALGLLFPTYPLLGAYPMAAPPLLDPPYHLLRVFGLSVMSNTAVISLVYPLYTLSVNARDGVFGDNDASLGRLLTARKLPISEVGENHGNIVETWNEPEDWTPSGRLTSLLSNIPGLKGALWFFNHGLYGLNAQFVRDYLSWRNDTLDEQVDHIGEVDNTYLKQFISDQGDDGWQTENVEGDREELQTLASQDYVWVTPGIPYLVPMTLGLLTSIFLGDAVWAAITFLG